MDGRLDRFDAGNARPDEPSEVEGTSVAWGENLTERRRRHAVALVQDRIAVVRDVLSGRVPRSTIQTGAATCAEVRLADEESSHRFLRISFSMPEGGLETARRLLVSEGWREAVPGSDRGIIQVAHRLGRRPHFVLIDGPDDPLDGPGAAHPLSPEGRALRRRRLQRAVIAPDLVMSRTRDHRSVNRNDLETIEIHLQIGRAHV